MSPDEYITQTIDRLQAAQYIVSTEAFPSGPVTVGYKGNVRVKWWASRLHLIVVLASPATADEAHVRSVLAEGIAYAKEKNKRWHKPSGIAVIAALVSEEASPQARAIAEARPKGHLFALSLPAVVDVSGLRTYSYRGRFMWGWALLPWLRSQLDAMLPPPTATVPDS